MMIPTEGAATDAMASESEREKSSGWEEETLEYQKWANFLSSI